MPGTVFTKSLRDQRRGLIGWSIGISATVAIMAAIWPSFSDMDIDAMLAEYPDAMKEVFNITSMVTGAGYINAELYSLMLPAMFIIFAVSRGARLVAGEEEEGTLELLASLPVSRSAVLLEKAAALTVGIIVLGLVLLATTAVMSPMVGLDIPLRDQANGALAMVLIGLEFGLVTLAVSAATGRRTLAVGIGAGLAGGAYLLYLMASLLESIKPYRVLSPFYQAISEGPIGPDLPPIVLAMPIVGLAALAVSVPVFRRRDLAI